MAHKLSAKDPVGKPRKRKTAAQKAAEEAQALDPTAELAVGGETLTVREYGFFQKARVLHHGRAFLKDIERVVGSLDGEDDDIFDEVRPLLGVHEDFVRYAIAESIGKPRAFVDGLGDTELEPLVYLWFGVAGRFFFGEIVLRARGRHLKAQLDGSTSSTSSVATSSGSADTPSGS